MTGTTKAAEDLRLAAFWLAAHPSLPPVYAIHRHDSGVGISWRVDTDAEAEALWALTRDDNYRSDHRYDDGDFSRILGGRIHERLRLDAVVERVEVTA